MNKSEKFWDRQSNEYDNQEVKYEKTYRKIIENTKKLITTNDIILDYACGTGIITNAIAEYVKEVYAIDTSARMIDIAKRKAVEHEIENINYKKTTIFDGRYKEESFNVILAFNILHLLKDTNNVIQRVNELLKPGGLFISATACLGEKATFLGFLLIVLSKLRILPYVKVLKFLELEYLIKNEDFQITETENLNQSPPNYFIAAIKRKNSK
jgi:2-polyprenyl-3-methyl-5-hydroxy-6-metoxy-1,4-benzoquinol methylase